MADIDLSTATSHPIIYTQASIPTTWQSYTLPKWGDMKITVTFEAAAGYVGFTQTGAAAQTSADGGAVGTHRQPIAADTPTELNLPAGTGSRVNGESPVTQIFLAAQTGTVTATLAIEKVGR